MLTKQKSRNIVKKNRQLNLKLAAIYLLLILLFISLMIMG
jgi:hypothetical protein